MKRKRDESPTRSGVMRLHPRGFGFVELDAPFEGFGEVFIPPRKTLGAVDGDVVEVGIDPTSAKGKGPDGLVLSILQRARSHLMGVVCSISRKGKIWALIPSLGPRETAQVIPHPDIPLEYGDRVILEMIEWGDKGKEPLCRPSRLIGHLSDASKDVEAAVEQHELRWQFPQPVINEAKQFGKQVKESDIKGRKDLRSETCFTIDPDTAKDFDDALSIEKLRNGHYQLGVHIADVSHYVRPDSTLDAEASLRCNSTYFPGICIPMLPKELSENLCSLKPHVNRLVVSVLMTFDRKGELLKHQVVRSVIKSAHRFTYKQAKKALDGKLKTPLLKELQLMVELCILLKKKRFERGSIEFATAERVILVNDQGEPTGTEIVEYDITHQLVEEFMLKANEVVAKHVTDKGLGLTFRVHEEPNLENLAEFVELARAYGYKLPDTPSQRDLQKLFQEVQDSPHSETLTTAFIKKQKMAKYSPENIGHFGLALTHYCHFTSPIRRYVDLIAHRILFGEIHEGRLLEMIAGRCSEQERTSARAEQSVLILKKLRYLLQQQHAHPDISYNALINQVTGAGITFAISELALDGFIHISQLGNDWFTFTPKQTLEGANTRQKFYLGQSIRVQVAACNLVTGDVEWQLI
ncbi:MAG: VacB/RNase II family 3'-5' exoribonuclease [Chlamydiia bacterium]|nr:VacB/RNase II family 3'-5' exoribonuclease [Chlamydiia bacterium]